jgi:hypothetical protein
MGGPFIIPSRREATRVNDPRNHSFNSSISLETRRRLSAQLEKRHEKSKGAAERTAAPCLIIALAADQVC